ncbi:hypothetical protein ABT316_17375 [Streptomyces cellulosae]
MGLAVAAVVMLVGAVSACGEDSDDSGDGQSSVPYGARTCSDWAGRMDESERWDAAEELLINAKGTDGTDGDRAPSTSVIEQFAVDMGAMCDRKASDDFLAVVADELYASNAVYYSL